MQHKLVDAFTPQFPQRISIWAQPQTAMFSGSCDRLNSSGKPLPRIVYFGSSFAFFSQGFVI